MSDEKQKDEICVHCPGSCVNLNASQWVELRGKCRLVSYVSSEIAAAESRVRAEEAAKYKSLVALADRVPDPCKGRTCKCDSNCRWKKEWLAMRDIIAALAALEGK